MKNAETRATIIKVEQIMVERWCDEGTGRQHEADKSSGWKAAIRKPFFVTLSISQGNRGRHDRHATAMAVACLSASTLADALSDRTSVPFLAHYRASVSASVRRDDQLN